MARNLARAAAAVVILSGFMLISAAQAGTLASSVDAPSTSLVASQLTDLGPGTLDAGRDFLDNGGPPGQSFQVTASGLVNRFTIKGGGGSSDAWNNGTNAWEGDEIWAIQISSVNTATGALTPIATETATGFTGMPLDADGIDISDYVTFTLNSAVNLTVGNTYAFSMYLSSAAGPGNDGGWFGIAHSATDVYAAGTAFNNNTTIDNPGGNNGAPRRDFLPAGFVAPNPNNFDYVFAVQAGGNAPLGPGDVNGDGFTNAIDYGIIKGNFFLTPATRAQGDLNADNRVNLSDFTLWRNNVPASVAASVGVPEPASLALAVGAVALLAARGRRTRRGK